MAAVPMRAAIAATLVSFLGGCASFAVDKSAAPTQQQVAAISVQIAKAREFHQAIHDVSTFAADRCARQSTKEPFALLTLGTLRAHLAPEEIAAYWRAGGFDENFHVLWAAPDSPIRAGDVVRAIDGDGIENNGAGEAPAIKYLSKMLSARDRAAEGRPVKVQTADGRQVGVPMVRACRTMFWVMPLAKPEARGEVQMWGEVAIAASALQQARTRDEYRYLAALGVYFTASAEADRKRKLSLLVGGVAVAGLLTKPLLYAATTFPTGRLMNDMASFGMDDNAAVFAMQVVHDMGGSAKAGLDVVDRLRANGLGADRVLPSPEVRVQLGAVAAKIEAGQPVGRALDATADAR